MNNWALIATMESYRRHAAGIVVRPVPSAARQTAAYVNTTKSITDMSEAKDGRKPILPIRQRRTRLVNPIPGEALTSLVHGDDSGIHLMGTR